MSKLNLKAYMDVTPEIEEAVRTGKPVVALESTILSHGMPYPENLGFEVDTFWVMRGGVDPVDMIKRLGTRVKLIHQKDFSKDSSSPKNLFTVVDPNGVLGRDNTFCHNTADAFTEIGTGTMDIQSILDCANELGSVEYVVLEQDQTKLDQMESIKVSMESFKKYNGIDFE